MRTRGIPGRTCPGLIEAGSRRRRASRGDPVFRGEPAPASLKLAQPPSLVGFVAVFRGEPAPASLKPDEVHISGGGNSRYSGANLPRPH